MSPVHVDHCGRRGCGKYVANGIQCSHCDTWFHENCTGLSPTQYTSLSVPDNEFRCMVCITAICPSVHTLVPTHPTLVLSSPEPTPIISEPIKVTSPPEIDRSAVNLDVIHSILRSILDQVERHGRSATDLSDGVAALNCRILHLEEICKALPLSRAATEAEAISKHMVEKAAAANADAASRARNILVRGLPYTLDNPTQTARNLLAPALLVFPQLEVKSASWFFRRNPSSPRPLLITLATAAQRTAVLQSKSLITDRNEGVQLHADRPFSKRPHNAALPIAAQLSVLRTNPAPNDQSPSTSSSNYQSPMASPIASPTKQGTHQANRSLPVALDMSTVAPKMRRNCSLPCLFPSLDLSTAMVTTERLADNGKSAQKAPTSPAVTKNGKIKKHKDRPPSNRNSTSPRNTKPGIRPPPLMSIKTHPPTYAPIFPAMHPFIHYPTPFNQLSSIQTLMGLRSLQLPTHTTLPNVLPSYPSLHPPFPPPIFTY
jgi:hypothetical protein